MSETGLPDDDSGSQDPDTQAAEYVLGVLTADEMRAVRVRSRGDAGLAASIADWELRLAPLAGIIQPIEPPPALWSRLEQAVAALPVETEAAPLPPPARAVPIGTPVPGRRVWPWQLSTGVSLALAAGFAALAFLPGLLARQPQPNAGGQRIATLGPVGAPPPAFLANAGADGRVTLTALSPADVPAGRDLELWVLPPGAQKVAPLGVLPVAGREVALPALPATGTQLLVSLEPSGGSATGQPTGPVLYAGTLASH